MTDQVAQFEIPCIICRTKYPLSSVGRLIFITTGVCRFCYVLGIKSPVSKWCFGKKDIHDPMSRECGSLCPDRRMCANFLKIQEENTRKTLTY